MARITLSPGEEFEHYHANESTTWLIKGEIRYRSDGDSFLLKPGHEFSVPPNNWHSLENIGKTEAEFGCSHGPPK